jgi:BA14K-like protein
VKRVSTALAAIGVAAMTAATFVPATSAFAAPPRFEDHGNYATYNNYRGSRDRQPGYRYYNGYWFPPGAFIAGAIIGGILGSATAPRTYAYAPPSYHVQWCEQHYRSYNPNSDTFFGYDGQYHYCVSPYG